MNLQLRCKDRLSNQFISRPVDSALPTHWIVPQNLFNQIESQRKFGSDWL